MQEKQQSNPKNVPLAAHNKTFISVNVAVVTQLEQMELENSVSVYKKKTKKQNAHYSPIKMIANGG